MIPTTRVPGVLSRARELVSPALEAAVASLTSEIVPVVRYHFGWVEADGTPTGNGGGKGVRQALAILSAEAAGAPSETGIPGAVAVELIHNFSLIHDDVMDQDRERRHRATVWSLFGVASAVIVGDALVALAQQVLLAERGEHARRAASLLADATASMIAGQALDMSFEHERFVDLARCTEMEAGKTGALLSCSASIGAVLAGADDSVVGALERFGMELGLSFQAVDDLLGIWGDPQTTGKPAWNDLRLKKKSVPVVGALERGGPAAKELSVLLAKPELDDAEIERAAELLERSGGREIATEQAEQHLANALSALESANLEHGATRELKELAHFVLEREF